MQNRRLIAAMATLMLAAASESASAAVLYDGALGTSPTSQGLAYGSIPLVDFYAAGPSSTTLDTSASNVTYAGFTNGTPIALDSSAGFTVRADVRIVSSTFTNSSRAGWSLIALDSNKRGIEIGFHTNEIFAQDDGSNLFVRDESVAFDTTAALTRYELAIVGDAYTLFANATPILSGPTRDYTPFSGLIDPYETPNFLFFGDDSTSAGGATEFSYVSVTVPEPSLAVAAILLLARRRR